MNTGYRAERNGWRLACHSGAAIVAAGNYTTERVGGALALNSDGRSRAHECAKRWRFDIVYIILLYLQYGSDGR